MELTQPDVITVNGSYLLIAIFQRVIVSKRKKQLNQNKKSNPHYTHDFTLKRVTSVEPFSSAWRLGYTAPKKRRSGGEPLPDLIGPGIKPLPSRTHSDVLDKLVS